MKEVSVADEYDSPGFYEELGVRPDVDPNQSDMEVLDTPEGLDEADVYKLVQDMNGETDLRFKEQIDPRDENQEELLAEE